MARSRTPPRIHAVMSAPFRYPADAARIEAAIGKAIADATPKHLGPKHEYERRSSEQVIDRERRIIALCQTWKKTEAIHAALNDGTNIRTTREYLRRMCAKGILKRRDKPFGNLRAAHEYKVIGRKKHGQC